MEKLFIICVDDQREVLSALTSDLEIFEEHVNIEECESSSEVWDLMEKIDESGDFVALIISDQVMPGNSGVDLLKKVKLDGRFKKTRKILLTGQATHQDTIEAINSAGLDNYIEKPWNKKSLHHIVKVLLTKFIMNSGIEYEQYLEVLDNETLYEILRGTTG
ncbi:MAG: two-component system chemotaxis response regulator CheY [Cyclobacteriaceae bacterium]|jgi:two-component system chemotaxis response regulator CheY